MAKHNLSFGIVFPLYLVFSKAMVENRPKNIQYTFHLFHQDHLAGQSLRPGLQLVEINAAGQVRPIERHGVRACCVSSFCQYFNFPT